MTSSSSNIISSCTIFQKTSEYSRWNCTLYDRIPPVSLRLGIIVVASAGNTGANSCNLLPRKIETALVTAATMILCVLAAIAQVDIRRLLAFHIMCQVAYMMLGLALVSLLGITAAIFYMFHSMFVQTGLFLSAGAMGRATGGYDLRRAGGLMRERPLTAALFATLALSLSGVPPLSGFWAKFLVIDAAFRAAVSRCRRYDHWPDGYHPAVSGR